MKKIKTRIFTSGILLRNKKILIIKRSSIAPRFPNMWDSIGGHLKDGNESAEDCMIREAKEEVGLDLKIKKAGKVYEFYDDYGRAIVIPFLLESDSDKVKLSFEHSEYKWIEPKDLKNYESAPDIFESAKNLGLIK